MQLVSLPPLHHPDTAPPDAHQPGLCSGGRNQCGAALPRCWRKLSPDRFALEPWNCPRSMAFSYWAPHYPRITDIRNSTPLETVGPCPMTQPAGPLRPPRPGQQEICQGTREGLCSPHLSQTRCSGDLGSWGDIGPSCRKPNSEIHILHHSLGSKIEALCPPLPLSPYSSPPATLASWNTPSPSQSPSLCPRCCRCLNAFPSSFCVTSSGKTCAATPANAAFSLL